VDEKIVGKLTACAERMRNEEETMPRAMTICRIIIDVMMVVFLPALMARPLTGNAGHEWIGACMAALFIAHNALNIRWYKNLLSGKYTARRTLQTAINFLVVLSAAGLIVSGLMMSRYVYGFLHVEGGTAFARRLHMVSAYWGFIFMSLHFGLHLGRIPGTAKRALSIYRQFHASAWALRGAAALVAAYGAYAFVRHDIASYLFLRNQFTFFDYDRAALSVFADYAAIMLFFAFAAHYSMKLFSVRKSKQSIRT
jgi:hypothetical protein